MTYVILDFLWLLLLILNFVTKIQILKINLGFYAFQNEYIFFLLIIGKINYIFNSL